MTTPRMRRVLITAFILVGIIAVVVLSWASRLSPVVRERASAALSERLQSKVELGSLRIAVFPRPMVTGQQLTLRHHGRTDVPPLITIDSFNADASLPGLIRTPIRLRTVSLDRLQVTIPPGGAGAGQTKNARQANGVQPEWSADSSNGNETRIIIDRLESREARLEIVPRESGKLSRVFDIHHLTMDGLGEGRGATFRASLTNPTPRGDISTEGVFGPWHGDEPGRTPVRGKYAFRNANLDTIKGLGGTLSSTGEYSGALDRIEVRGDTDTPDFSIDIAGQPVPLRTRFQAIVDGTNGDTWLDPVEARVIDTPIVARGAVVRGEHVKGRRVELDVEIADGRIEDVLKLAVKSARPLMTGRMQLQTELVIPAGDDDVIDKLQLDGSFALNEARFTDFNIQQRINTLSRRGKGVAEGDGPSVVSSLSGNFRLQRGTLRLSNLSFGVPGAVVVLAGTYDLRREVLDFRGHLLLDAELAETTTGFKSLLARIAQPFFRRPGGGSKLPIRISGPRQKPEFGLDVKRALTR